MTEGWDCRQEDRQDLLLLKAVYRDPKSTQSSVMRMTSEMGGHIQESTMLILESKGSTE